MIIFRADANSIIGSGHIMRCLSIAQALRERGAECLFISADDGGNKLVAESGFPYRTIHSDYRNYETELTAFCTLLKELHPDLVVVDSYSVTESYFQKLGNHSRIAYIDDLAERSYPVNFIINYNISANVSQYARLYPHPIRRLLGVTYAPLRAEFSDLPLEPREYCKNLLLSTGGADPLHVGIRLLETIIRDPRTAGLNTHIIVGSFHQDADAIMQLALQHPSIIVHQRVSRMAELMCGCDLAVSAAGSTLYELCACGVPSVCYTFVDNQLQIAQGFSDAGLIKNAGDFRKNPVETEHSIIEQIARLCREPDQRQQISERMRKTVDGRGAWRIADSLLGIQTLA